MGSLLGYAKMLIFFIAQIYCGFIQDSYITITHGVIVSFSNNRYDPRFMVTNYTTNAAVVCAINYNTVWMLKNITGLGYYKVIERSNQLSTFTERSIFLLNLQAIFYNENMTAIINSFGASNQIINLGLLSNEVFMGNYYGTPTLYQMRHISNNTAKWNYTISSYTALQYDIQNSSVVAILVPGTPNGNILLDVRTIINSSSTVILNSKNIVCSNSSAAQIKASRNYYGIFNGSQIQIFNYCQNCSAIWNLSISSLTNFEFCGPWFLYSSLGVIYQLYVNNGTVISSFQTKYTNPRVKVVEINGFCLTNIHQINQSTILRAYLDNSTGTFIQNQTFSSIVNFLNYTSLIISNSTYMNSSNSTNSTNSTTNSTVNSINTTTNSTGNTTATNSTTTNSTTTNSTNSANSANSIINISNTSINGWQSSYALSQNFLQQNFNETMLTENILITISAINSIRMKDFLRMYFIINQLGFHNYHNINYTGIVKNILDFMNFIQTNIWTLTNSQQILQRVQGIYQLPDYTDYTNIKFLEVEGRDSFFFEITKDYFFMLVPISIFQFIAFFFLYKALKCSNLGAKSLFKTYSLSYGIVLVLFIQNISRLTLLACHNFKHLFFLNTQLFFMQGITVLFVGFMTILSVSFFYHLRYLYGKKTKWISFNLRRIIEQPTIQLIRFVLRPVIQIAFNVFFFQKYNYVILSLSMTQLFIVFIMSLFQIHYCCFKKKMEFTNECIYNLTLCLFNFILFLKYYAYPQLDILFEWCVEKLAYFMMVSFFVDFVLFNIEIGKWIKKFFSTKENEDIKQKNANKRHSFTIESSKIKITAKTKINEQEEETKKQKSQKKERKTMKQELNKKKSGIKHKKPQKQYKNYKSSKSITKFKIKSDRKSNFQIKTDILHIKYIQK